ncbi:COG4 transport protein-domain-containing protein [Mycena floridula]|nr:COG4 transport protein-domain-containing protein [Mycena floridula]
MAARDCRTLTSLQQILSALSACQAEESELSNSLSNLLSAREPIIISLSRLQTLVPKLDELQHEASSLSAKVSTTAKTAERIGGKVRDLDEEMRRIREAGDRVGQVIDLKSSLSALEFAIHSQDWESATRHCARAMSLPPEVISGQFSETAVPTSESHLPPSQTLQSAREHLLQVFRKNFDQASRSRDATATTRFFKLFPTIGWEAEGLEAYSSFVVDLVRLRAPASAKTSSPLYYITALTALFENIALIVDQHHPVVVKYYGTGKMQSVVERLLEECDRVVKGLIEGWQEERAMRRKLADALSSPPTFSQPGNSRRAASPVDEGVDPREIDKVLTEVSAMSGRWNLFRIFLTENLANPPTEPQEELPDSQPVQPEDSISFESTSSFHIFEDLLSAYYIPLEIWYMRTIIHKAHRLASPDASQSIAATTTPDDVFYILKIALLRLLSTGSLPAVERMFDQLREVLEQDYIGIIKKKLDDVYRGSGPSGTNMRGGVDRENRLAFITLLNDLDIRRPTWSVYVAISGAHATIGQHFMRVEQPAIKDRISTFASLAGKFRSTMRVGIEQLFNQLIRPKLRTLIPEVYKDVSYVLDDDSYSTAEYQDVVRKRFIKTWDGLMDGYKDTFTDGNFRLYFGLTLDVVLRPWEKFMMGFKFTELGAVRFDRDLRSITTYLSSQTAFGDARDKFVRLQQMSTLLNLDPDEDVDEFYNGSGISWRLTAQEARSIAGLKI